MVLFLKAGKAVCYWFLIGLLLSCSIPRDLRSPPGSFSAPGPVAGVPAPHASPEAYGQARRQLLKQDSLRAFDARVALSTEEQVLNRRLIALREQMLARYDSAHFFPPARPFHQSKAHMYASPLYQVLRQMPKGGVHHLHAGAAGNFRWMIRRAMREPSCYVYWRDDEAGHLKGQLHFYRAHQVPPGFYSIRKLNDSIPGFGEQLHDLLTFDGSPENDSTDVWTEFENCFRRIDGFVSYQPVFKDVYVACFDSLLADGVPHVELRVGLAGGLYDLEHSPGAFPADSVIAYLQQAAQQVQRKHNQAFTFKIIYANLRFRPLDAIRQDLVHAFAIRARYPDLVKAYDLVAHEDAGHATDYFREAWLMRDSLAKVYGVDLPLCLHDGESNWEHVTNLYDAVLLGSVRIGHGLNLSFFPGVEDLVREQNICMEVSPLSNQVLGYVGDLRMHPAHAWIKRGIQISISPDDPAIFDYTGVTPDYWSICLAWELDLQALKKLSMNGILYSQLSEAEQQEALRVWQDRWQRFVAYANRVLQ